MEFENLTHEQLDDVMNFISNFDRPALIEIAAIAAGEAFAHACIADAGPDPIGDPMTMPQEQTQEVLRTVVADTIEAVCIRAGEFA